MWYCSMFLIQTIGPVTITQILISKELDVSAKTIARCVEDLLATCPGPGPLRRALADQTQVADDKDAESDMDTTGMRSDHQDVEMTDAAAPPPPKPAVKKLGRRRPAPKQSRSMFEHPC